jgi:uncharacterized RmlC-like cupin family protein
MTASRWGPGDSLAAPPEAEARIVKPLQFDDDTPQTSGMRRLAAVSGLLVGSEKLWAGVMMAEPSTTSKVHHHGPLETVVYVAEGRSTLRWGRRLEHETELEAGDFLFVPPHLPHQEINPSADQPALWIVVRSGPEAIVVDLAPGPDGEYVAPGSGKPAPAPRSWIWRPVSAVAALGVVVVEGLWAWSAARAWQPFLQAGALAVLAVLGIGWAIQARTARPR